LKYFLEERARQVARIQESLAQADAGTFASESEVQEAFAKWGVTAEPE
jgi:predicted transcriptional regulator